ncbi:MAG: protein phosphatase 2C domain-containing protein [Desulfosarcinaceae bacterium]
MQIDTLYENGSGRLNEDYYIAEGNLFGVFDGATSLTPQVYENGVTGGYLASNIAGNTFLKNNNTLFTLFVHANRAIGTAMVDRGVCLQIKHHRWNTSAAVVRIEEEFFDWIQIGDCLVFVIYKDGTHRILTEEFDHDRETLQLWKKSAHSTSEPILTALKDQIIEVRARMNIDYGALNGEDEAISFLNSGTEKLQDIRHVVLFTDGLFIPNQKPAERTDFRRFAALFQKGGLSSVRDFVRELEKSDVACRKYPRFKTHDDIAAISITFQ